MHSASNATIALSCADVHRQICVRGDKPEDAHRGGSKILAAVDARAAVLTNNAQLAFERAVGRTKVLLGRILLPRRAAGSRRMWWTATEYFREVWQAGRRGVAFIAFVT